MLALDGFMREDLHPSERRGWLALSAVLLVLSFDEIASVHEAIGLSRIVPFGLAGLAATTYALVQLYRGGVSGRRLGIIIAAFALFGTVAVQEKIQHLLVWQNQWIYGARALLEEGVEIVGMLLLVGVTRANTAALLAAEPSDAFAAVRRFRVPVLVAAFVLAPVMTAATFVLPYPGGPADWLAASVYLLCALLVVRRILLSRSSTPALVALLLFYLIASAGSNAVDLDWDPVVLDTRVGVRALFLALLLFSSTLVLRADGRRPGVWPILGGALALLGAVEWPESQALWCLVPALLGACFYVSESRAVVMAAPRPVAGVAGATVPARSVPT
jgi:hypothetical protein